MASTAQANALKNYRKRLTRRGMARFEVLGLAKDRDLVRAVARRLAEGSLDAAEIRATLSGTIEPDTPKKGGILEMLRNSPLMGTELNVTRRRVSARKVKF